MGPGTEEVTLIFAIHAMVIGGGIAALSWEVVWQLQASLAFGISAAGTAVTLAATMGGMTLGSLAAGAWLDRRAVRRPLRVYGLCELVIGVSGLVMLSGFALLEQLDAIVYAQLPALAAAFQGLGIAVLLAPATLAMGATIPVFQLVARATGSSVSTLYAANTAGAAAGVLLLSFALLPAFGVFRTCLLVAGLNGSVFVASRIAGAAATGASPASSAPADVPTADGRPRALAPDLALVVVFCTGFVTFALEVVWFRALRAAFWSTSQTFAIMLAAVLIPLAAGARWVPWLRRRRDVSVGMLLAIAGTAILVATPLVERMDILARETGSFHFAMGIWLLLSLLAVGPPVLLLATAVPWLLEDCREPRMTGRLYGCNTLGAVAGSLAGAWLLLPALGFARAAWLLGSLVVAVALIDCRPRRRPAFAAVGTAALAFAALASSSPGHDRPLGASVQTGDRVLALREGPDFSASVVQSASGARSLTIDGFTATSEGLSTVHYMYWMGSLPALLHPQPRRGLVICFGTGQTANALRREGLAHIDVVDVSQSVFELASFFTSNEHVLDDPRVSAITMDGRAWLRRGQVLYDVVTLEPMPPNFSGVNSLYSQEFYEIVSQRLAPGGIVAQWLPVHLLTPRHAASVAATFRAVLPDAVLWYDPVGGTGILLGRREGVAEPLGTRWPGLARPVTEHDLGEEAIRRSVWLDGDALARYADGARLVTDDNQLLQFSDLRAGLRGERSVRLMRSNLAILRDVAGRPPYRVRSTRRDPVDRMRVLRRRGNAP